MNLQTEGRDIESIVQGETVMSLNSFLDVQNFITQVLTESGKAGLVRNSPHESTSTLRYINNLAGTTSGS